MFKKILPALLVVGYSLSLYADLPNVTPLLEYHDLIVTHSLEAGSLKVKDDAKIKGDLKVENDAKIKGDLSVKGDETVSGSVTAESFITSTGPLFNGLRNYAVLSNQAAVTTGETILWAATAGPSVSSGISVDTGNGSITLPTSGIFLVQYTVRLYRTTGVNPGSGVAQLYQTESGTLTPITQPVITTNTASTDEFFQYSTQLTGFAIVNVTSSENNVINLQVTLSGGMEIAVATGTDSNAQMTILQLN